MRRDLRCASLPKSAIRAWARGDERVPGKAITYPAVRQQHLRWRAAACWSARSRGCAAAPARGGSPEAGRGRSPGWAGLTAAAGNTWHCWKTALRTHNRAKPRGRRGNVKLELDWSIPLLSLVFLASGFWTGYFTILSNALGLNLPACQLSAIFGIPDASISLKSRQKDDRAYTFFLVRCS